MTGVVDDSGRALIHIRLRRPNSSAETKIDAWIDTGFTGELVLPLERIVSLGLPLCSGMDAILADGSKVKVEAYTCRLHWFGMWREVEIIANNGQYPLLGVGLLLERKLSINYRARTLRLA